ncbi:MAG: hypothetical protein SGI90_13435 [Candidatus Eisenbacteria bacterium]|nr:hypothetical protein [Candidatus Eisenbacteria bacterium]
MTDDRGPGEAARADRVLGEMIDQQRAKVLRVARDHAPRATPEDILNPHDIPELAAAPIFHFEDGILAGLISARIALRAEAADGGAG